MTAIEMNTQIKTSMRLETSFPTSPVFAAAAPILVAQYEHNQEEHNQDVHNQDDHNHDHSNLDEHID